MRTEKRGVEVLDFEIVPKFEIGDSSWLDFRK